MSSRRWLLAVAALLALGTSLRAKERWLRVRTPEFTVITSLPERDAKAWAGEFAQYVAALRTLLDERRPLPPLTIVLFDTGYAFERFRPLNGQGKPKEVEGFFLRHESWAVAGLTGASQSTEVRRTVFHEGAHWFLSTGARPNPVWLEEGIAEVFSTFEVTPKAMTWGRPIKEHVGLLNTYGLLPLEKLLSASQGDLFADDSRRTNIVYAESWALVHFLRFGRHDLPRDGLSRFVAAVQQGSPQAEAFRAAFGKTVAEIEPLFVRYIRGGEYVVRHVDLIPVPEARLEPASTLEVEDALARLAFAGRRFDDAVAHARAAIAAAPESPRGHEVLGMVFRQQAQRDAALAEFKLAIEKGTRDFLPFFEVAGALQHAADLSAGGTLAPAEARQIADYYEKALDLHPRFALSYENLAGIIGLVEPWTPQDRDYLERGAQLFPGDAFIRVGRAILVHRSGDVAAAHATLGEIIRDAEAPDSARNYARRLDESWENQAALKEIERLATAQKYSEALALVDRTLEGNADPGMRVQLFAFRQQLNDGMKTEVVDAALRDQRYADARKFCTAILGSDSAPAVKAQARRILEQLDERQLGLEPKP